MTGSLPSQRSVRDCMVLKGERRAHLPPDNHVFLILPCGLLSFQTIREAASNPVLHMPHPSQFWCTLWCSTFLQHLQSLSAGWKHAQPCRASHLLHAPAHCGSSDSQFFPKSYWCMHGTDSLFKGLTWLGPSASVSFSCISQGNWFLSMSNTFSFFLQPLLKWHLYQVIADIPASLSFYGASVAGFSFSGLECHSSHSQRNAESQLLWLLTPWLLSKWLVVFRLSLSENGFCLFFTFIFLNCCLWCSDHLKLISKPWLIQAKNYLQPSFSTNFYKNI